MEVERFVVHLGDQLVAYAASAFYSEEEAAVSVWAAIYLVGGDPTVYGAGEGVAAGDLVSSVSFGLSVVSDKEDGAEVPGEPADGCDLG